MAKKGEVKTKFTFKSFWRGVKAYEADAPIDGTSEKGIRTLFKDNLKNDATCIFKRKFSKENSLLANLFSKDQAKSARALESIAGNFRVNYTFTSDVRGVTGDFNKCYKILKANQNVFKNYKNTIGNLEKISNGTFDMKSYLGGKTYRYLDEYQGISLTDNLFKNGQKLHTSVDTFRENISKGIGWAF